ncbi:MAG: hypothetical protein JXL80_15260 [Planctomycetes bacterium]|nr:hypothetical protein [Planctomycetota bacterium]
MRSVMFIGLFVGSAIGWWAGNHYLGIWGGLAGSTVGGFAGIYLVYRLTRDYL